MKNIVMKSRIKLDTLLQTLGNGKKVLDFNKIEEQGFPIVLLITQRGAMGKTVNMKDMVMKRYLSNKEQAMYIYNTTLFMDKEFRTFESDMLKPNVVKECGEDWFKIKKRSMGGFYEIGDDFITMAPLNAVETLKGARKPYKRLVWDEFNVKDEYVKNPIHKIDSLLHTLEDVVANHKKEQDLKFYLFGNNKSLNNRFILQLGITHLPHEISELYDDNDNKLVLIIAPKFDKDRKKEIEEDNKKNWIFGLSKRMGTAEHAYFNGNLEDEINGIIRIREKDPDDLEFQISIKQEDQYYNIYDSKSRVGSYHIVKVKKHETDKEEIFALNKNSITESVDYRIDIKDTLLRYFISNDVTYEDISSRILFTQSIIK